MKRICIQCGREFEMSAQEIALFESKKLEIPKRCRACRKANRIKNNDAVVQKKKRSVFPRVGIGNGNPMTGLVAILIIVFAVFFGNMFRDSDGHQKKTGNPDTTAAVEQSQDAGETLVFRNFKLLNEHYKKHGKEMGFASAEEYLKAANDVVKNPNALHKTEKEDGDDVYFVKETGDFVIVSTDGYIRTYFRPEDGIAYYNRQ